MDKEYDVVIVGAGVSGAALLYVLSHYTNVKNIALIEKHHKPAQVNSHHTNNSQTLHFGDIETNYTVQKARKVKRAADMVRKYVDKHDKSKKMHSKYNKMVLAVGEEEVKQLRQRHKEFKKLFPNLKAIEREEIQRLEPKVVEGRPEDQELFALASKDGYTMNFERLADSFVEKALKKPRCQIDTFFETRVKKMAKEENSYQITTSKGTLNAKVLAVTAGAHSLLFAKSLGHGKEFALLSVAGSFYFAPQALNGKVYTMQMEKLPFAAVHGDPEVHDQNKTRFGPTAKVLPMLERRNYRTVHEYFKTAGLTVAAFHSFFKILSDPILLKYIVTNFFYDTPFLGKRMFTKEAKKVVPTMKNKHIKKAKGYGGVRPQVVNKKTKSLDMGEAKILGENAIFNITPSPGASTCLRNAEDDTLKIMDFLGKNYTFNHKKFKKDFG